jgi:hypothetical protein
MVNGRAGSRTTKANFMLWIYPSSFVHEALRSEIGFEVCDNVKNRITFEVAGGVHRTELREGIGGVLYNSHDRAIRECDENEGEVTYQR